MTDYERETEERRREYLDAPYRFYVFVEGSTPPAIVNAKSAEEAALSLGHSGTFSVHRSGALERATVNVRPAPRFIAERTRR